MHSHDMGIKTLHAFRKTAVHLEIATRSIKNSILSPTSQKIRRHIDRFFTFHILQLYFLALGWSHKRPFGRDIHVHSKVRAESKEETEQVGEYMIRPILSLRRLSLDEAQVQVIYQYGKHSAETERMDYLEFIARVTPHIPDKGS